MKKETTAVFIGHSKLGSAALKDNLKNEIIRLIKSGVNSFLNGGMGDFDMLCAECIRELKKEYPDISHTLVLPYLSFNQCNRNLFDYTIYPNLEISYYRAAIPVRNEWMVKNAAYAVCFVCNTYGGAVQTYKKAVQNGLSIINLGTLPTVM